MKEFKVSRTAARAGVALVMVLLVLTALAIIGAPFVIAMVLQEKSSMNFDASVKARRAAEAARNHAIALLEKTARNAEGEEEAEKAGVDDQPRLKTGRFSLSSEKRRPSRRSSSSQQRRGMVIREDQGEKREPKRRERFGSFEQPAAPGLMESQKGPAEKDYDEPGELDVHMPESAEIPFQAPTVLSGTDLQAAGKRGQSTTTVPVGPVPISFRDPRGLTASVEVADEQGKINLNTATPILLANLFGSSVLERPLHPGDAVMVLEDAGPFRDDGDPRTVDGAVVIGPMSGEVITYRERKGNVLQGCFRGAFFSLPSRSTIDIGTMVYDLRGWKAGFHKLRAGAIGGFTASRLAEFATVEALREVSNWQVASLFLTRLRGEGLTAEFLRQHGIRASRLEELGLDPALFEGEGGRSDRGEGLKRELELARRTFRRLNVSRTVTEGLEKAYGMRAAIAFAARIEHLHPKEVQKEAKALEERLRKEKRQPPKFDKRYLEACLENLADVYRTPGIETILPQDLELLRDCITVSSAVPAKWSEPQVNEEAILAGEAGGGSVRIARPDENGGFAVVRIRDRRDPSAVEYNMVTHGHGGAAVYGFSTLFPLLNGYGEREAWIDFLERHPVNVNTAPPRVIQAVLTGVSGAAAGSFRPKEEEEKRKKEQAAGQKRGQGQDPGSGGIGSLKTPGLVTPAEAAHIAGVICSRRPLKGYLDLHDLFVEAADAGAIDDQDVYPLYLNAIQPNHHLLRVSTTGFCFASGDVYTISSRGILRGEAGGELAQVGLREIVEVSPPEVQRWLLFTQFDFTSEIYLRNPWTPRAPEDHAFHSVSLPGARSHLVRTTPVLYKVHWTYARTGAGGISRFAVPGAERGTLRLELAETFAGRTTFGQIEHFRETREGLELPGGEPWEVPDFDLGGEAGGGSGRGVAAGGKGGGIMDLTNVPAAVETWVKFRTFPQESNRDGLLILMDAGAEEERNRISLLFDQKTSEWVARIYDSSIPDPSIPKGKQFFEIRAQRPLDLDTWYHLRLAWDGAYSGGIQLFIDGLPAGRSNFTTELSGSLSSQSNALPIKDFRDFPKSGVLRVNHELIEYENGQIRIQDPSYFERWLAAQPAAQAQQPPGGTLSQPGQGTARLPKGGLKASLQRGAGLDDPGNHRASVRPANHPAGSPAALHGYSLMVDRNYWYHRSDFLFGTGGLRLAGDLLPWKFPPDVWDGIYNYNPKIVPPGGGRGKEGGQVPAGGAAAAGQKQYLAPVFMRVSAAGLTASPSFEWGGQAYFAHEFFQSEGVVMAGGQAVFYRKVPLPSGHPIYNLIAQGDPNNPGGGAKAVNQEPLQGLEVYATYPPGGQVDPTIYDDRTYLRLYSVLASGPVANFYPVEGILELRGARPLWRRLAGEPELYAAGGSVFGHHPDDTVEWIRYHDVSGRMFIGLHHVTVQGKTNVGAARHRDYPRQENHMFHRGGLSQSGAKFSPGGDRLGEPLRLVMEVAGGGAGYGDYVSISTDDPQVYEPMARRVYRASERNDGRFWVSLWDVNPGEYKAFKYNYTAPMNPRLVKFPTGSLPQVGGGRMVFFGDAVRGSPPSASALSALSRNVEEEETSGFVIDEVEKLYDPGLWGAPSALFNRKHVLVPLEGGTVKREPLQTPLGPGEVIAGTIPRDRTISRQNPLDILVVSAGRGNYLFARSIQRGVLSVNDEYFFFENPKALESTAAPQPRGSQAAGRARLTDIQPPDDGRNGLDSQFERIDPRFVGMRSPYARMIVRDLTVDNVSGDFEREGFARIESLNLNNGFEIFYYQGFGGGNFSNCLRGQFHTAVAEPMVVQAGQQGNQPVYRYTNPIQNVTVRLRLIGRGLLGTERKTHGFGDPISLVTCVDVTEITGPMTDVNLAASDTKGFPPVGYLLLDSTLPNRPFEMIAYTGIQGENLFLRPRDEDGKGILRSSFGTVLQPIEPGMFAYAMPFRHFDRYQPETESESLAYFQKSFRMPGATWRSISWRERKPLNNMERLCDLVVAARFDGAPDWSEKPANQKGGIFFFEAPEQSARREDPVFDLDVTADQLDVRVYFRYKRGSFMRVRPDHYRDDWKETPVLELLSVEYEKAGRILRHEETNF
ncbi:MAG: hypothetical protein HY717_14580 [Planctomycetes bacterium]|nr:hypothetical protein [Planctomycetota bacterium]